MLMVSPSLAPVPCKRPEIINSRQRAFRLIALTTCLYASGAFVADAYAADCSGTYSTPGSFSCSVPAGASSAEVEVWGAGAAAVEAASTTSVVEVAVAAVMQKNRISASHRAAPSPSLSAHAV